MASAGKQPGEAVADSYLIRPPQRGPALEGLGVARAPG
jgi:hypothetical protein